MKKTLFIILIISIFNSKAQDLVVHELLPPDSKEHTDLHFLNKELEGNRIVMLGEKTHMYGNIFEMKIRVIEYLHEELGYNTIAMESPMYAIWKMNRSSFSPKNFNNANNSVWSKTIEFQRLVKYIEKNNIKVIGFDSQINNNYQQFIDDFFNYCKKQNIKITLKSEDMAIVIEGILNIVQYEKYDISFTDFERELKNIIHQISELGATDDNYYWKQFVKGVLACSRDAYYNDNDKYIFSYVDKQNNFRDKQMADNILSYMARNKDEKVICWADNMHTIVNISSIKKSVKNGFIPMGSYIKKSLGKEAYSLATLHANDSILNIKTNRWHKTPILKPSFEHTLQSFNLPYLFVSSNQEHMKVIQKQRLLSFSKFTEARLDQLHDGYIFLKHATIPKDELNLVSKDTANTINKSLHKNKKVKVTYLKGQVLDFETNAPIPYANIILKSKAMYRIADDHGKFKFPVPNKTSLNSLVTVSSMGYSSKNIPLSDLNSKIKLNPNFESLEEVVLTGHLSPKVVLKKAIEKIEENHPTTPFNTKRYHHTIKYRDDKLIQDIELIAKEYDQGYRQPYVSTQNYKQIRRNLVLDKKYKGQLVSTGVGRENPIRYANILHKRKYKKFNLKFVKSNNSKNDDLYIISFDINRDRWNYTNRAYPTAYSGKIFINRNNFAIIKITENWETTLRKKKIKKYKFWLGEKFLFNKFKEIKIKEKSICSFSNIYNNKHYLSKMIKTSYVEIIDINNKLKNSVYESKSMFFDINTKDVEKIEYKKYKQYHLKKIKYNKKFWDLFDKSNKQMINEFK